MEPLREKHQTPIQQEYPHRDPSTPPSTIYGRNTSHEVIKSGSAINVAEFRFFLSRVPDFWKRDGFRAKKWGRSPLSKSSAATGKLQSQAKGATSK